ncbi:MAG: hydroxymethylbilane synthase [Candidatus Methylopumilus sp.]|nr:hydroxymethylbilane synthase [Candidatus Methylopumilus sp.]
MTQPTHIIIATRKSQLALWQADFIKEQLLSFYPRLEVSILGMTTQGDKTLNKSLSKIGGKGLFIKELEIALQNKEADIAVHSLKDLPMHLSDEFIIAAIGKREDARDAFISNDFGALEMLPAGSVIGTSSLRRQSQLQRRFPELTFEPLRGNLQTRLRKLDKNQYQGIILAAAGLIRLKLKTRIRQYMSTENSIPAAGQGALAIEILKERSDLIELLKPLHHPESAQCVLAERAMSRILSGSCNTPLGAYAIIENKVLKLQGFVASIDGKEMIKASIEGSIKDAEKLGEKLGKQLLDQGADKILASLIA